MSSRPLSSFSISQLAWRAAFVRVLLALSVLAGAPQPAAAKDPLSDFFGSLFGGPRARPERPAPRVILRRTRPEAVRASPRRSYADHDRDGASSRRAPRAAPRVAVAPAPKPNARFFVAVIGDSEAMMLAQGLNEAFADNGDIAFINKAREDTGLVRDDFYDWRKAAKELLEGPQHFDMAVIEIGVNDNQRLRVGDASLDPLSKPFNEVYAKRIEEIAALFREMKTPLVWVGLPIMRSESLSNAALAFNDMARQYASAQGARYVDLWEAFSDIDSAYKPSGPDINGAIVRLRAADGVHFNPAGARKAAHFVEPEIRHVLEAALTPSAAPAAPPPQGAEPQAAVAPEGAAPAEAPGTEAVAPQKPVAGKVEALTDPAVAPGGALASVAPRPPAPVSAPHEGRADDFRWPAK